MPASSIVTPERQDILEEDILAKGSVSEALLRKIAASLNAANYYSALPLGTILTNEIPPSHFFELATNAWWEYKPADYTNTDYGQWLISRGLKSGTLTMTDGRGMELVQVNSGRNDGHENFENIAAGGFQDQHIQSHRHSGVIPNGSVVTNRGYHSEGSPVANDDWSGYTSYAGSSQTNSKRIGVYRYIKVWNVDPAL